MASSVLTSDEGMDNDIHRLYKDLYVKLVKQAAFILGDISAAEDIAQEAFLRLHRTGLPNIANPGGWLVKVINNLCYDYISNEGNRKRREEKYLSPTHVASAENLAMDKEEVRLVQKALTAMQPRDRMVLLMKFSGYSYDEIAATTGINRVSVGTILARARERFKSVYEKLL